MQCILITGAMTAKQSSILLLIYLNSINLIESTISRKFYNRGNLLSNIHGLQTISSVWVQLKTPAQHVL